MTEEEAKTKWCPWAQGRLVEWKKAPQRIENFLWEEKPSMSCLASSRIAWRWRAKPANAPHTGYCGLAGMPK